MNSQEHRSLPFAPQVRVRHKDGRLGTLCTTIYMLLSDGDDELSVVFDDGDGPITLNCLGGRNAFTVIGLENAQADPMKCGAGRGAECCIFLTVGASGFCCERYSGLRYTLQFKTMNAKREPSEPFPACQLPSASVSVQDNAEAKST